MYMISHVHGCAPKTDLHARFEINIFFCRNLILFSEKNYKKQAQIIYQNHSLGLPTVGIFWNLILRNHSTY